MKTKSFKTIAKRISTLFLCILMLMTIMPLASLAANYSTNYSSYAAPTRTLIYQNPNMYGNDVRWFQCAINYLIVYGDNNNSKLSATKLDVDGYYGPASKNACIAFQRKYGLSQDGMFGPASRSKMNAVLQKYTPVPTPGTYTNVTKYLKSLIGTSAKDYGVGTGTQCVELPKYYMYKYFGISNQYVTTGNGNQMYYKVPAAFPTKFTQINYTNGMALKPGDILSIGSKSSPQYGHAVIVYEVSGNTVKFIEQWNGSGTVRSGSLTISNGYTNKGVKVYGVARPKNVK